jgi:glycine/D-amino acid oxidase-like deaminating enzyme
MSKSNPRIAIIGAGVIGASVAFRLARGGGRVQLFDLARQAGAGVSGRSFGWINMINGDPTNQAAYALRRHACAAFDRLADALPEAFVGSGRGALFWRDSPDETAALIQNHRAAGVAIKVLGRDQIIAREPSLRVAPELAAYASDDLAIDPGALTTALVAAAGKAGAEVYFGQEVIALERIGRRMTGLRTRDGTHLVDVVVLAAGAQSDDLAAMVGIELNVRRSPALLLRYSAGGPFLRHIVCGPEIEVRQAADDSLMIAASCDGAEDAVALTTIGNDMLEIVRRCFVAPEPLALMSAEIGFRPMFDDHMPRLGFLPGVEGLYVAAGHPGVILAPLLGELSADEILKT